MVIDTEKENQLLHDFLNGDTVAQDEFPAVMMPWILRTARAIGKDLPEDLREEIAQQTFVNLLYTVAADFEPTRGTARSFLIGKIWNAEKQVRASYGFPERRKKKPSEENEDSTMKESSPKTVSINAIENFEIPTPHPELNLVEKIYVESLIENAPSPIDIGLRLIYREDKSHEEAAKIAGLSRFQFYRQTAVYRSQLMAA